MILSATGSNSSPSLDSSLYNLANKPSKKSVKLASTNIKKGIKSLNKLNAHNHVQGLIIRGGTIIAKETSKGTKKMIQSVKNNRKNQGKGKKDSF